MNFFLFTLSMLAALDPGQLLVETDQLGELDDTLILDTRPAEAYEAGHIPGAVNLRPADMAETRDGVAGLLKPLGELANILAENAIDPNKHIVIYSDMGDGSDVKDATRLFWILEYLSYSKVSILNGGYAKWLHEDRAVSTEALAIDAEPDTQWELRTRPELLAKRGRIISAIQSGNEALVDNRSPEQYTGLSKSPVAEKKGHIPGAINLPAGDFVETEPGDGDYVVFKTGEALSETIGETGIDGEKPVISYCNSGRDASVGYVGYRLGGFKSISLYDGSMAEWTRESPVVVTPTE